MIWCTSKVVKKFPFEDEFKIRGCMMNRQGKTCNAVEERNAFSKQSLLEGHQDIQE